MNKFENYYQEKKTIDIVQANAVAFGVFFVAALLFTVPFYFIWGYSALRELPSFGEFLTMMIIGIVAHELIHGLFFGLYAENGFKNIRFGVMWKILTPYCHCKVPLKIKHYLIGALMPALILGFIPAITALFIGNAKFLVFGIFFIGSATGDFMVAWILRKEKLDDYVQDHPSEAGCWVYRKNKIV
ncbi:MAG: DUF3267 domain-containing protein [Petrimonas sp.]|jgi:hypothetical protein|nr:MAG: hypothetical protein BWZ00_01844 [Bacteroidetes bacterium ADurb.BinA174]